MMNNPSLNNGYIVSYHNIIHGLSTVLVPESTPIVCHDKKKEEIITYNPHHVTEYKDTLIIAIHVHEIPFTCSNVEITTKITRYINIDRNTSFSL